MVDLRHHGGGIRAAANRFGIPVENWLDLSTGINPHGRPVPDIPARDWQRLPEDSDGLEEAARAYYSAPHLLPVAGSQAAILALSRLRSTGTVAVLAPSYSEHAVSWRQAGHAVMNTAMAALEAAAERVDVLVVVNPNNPTGQRFPTDQLLDWHARLHRRGGWLVVDEAFMDSTPEQSLCSFTDRDGLIVLRSLGKFFGLAGARVGFVCAAVPLLETLANWLGPWTVAGPARWVAQRALADGDWQRAMRRKLHEDSARLAALLNAYGRPPDGGTDLFQWVRTDQARAVHETLAASGILTRLFDAPPSLRFGLPGSEDDWRRLERALRVLHQSEAGDEPSAEMHEAMMEKVETGWLERLLDRRENGA